MIIVYHPPHFYPQTTIITFHLVTMDRTLKLVHAEFVNFVQVRFCEKYPFTYVYVSGSRWGPKYKVCRQL